MRGQRTEMFPTLFCLNKKKAGSKIKKIMKLKVILR